MTAGEVDGHGVHGRRVVGRYRLDALDHRHRAAEQVGGRPRGRGSLGVADQRPRAGVLEHVGELLAP